MKTTLHYSYKPGRNLPIPATVVGGELERIRKANDGILQPSTVVDEAKPKTSPIHGAFTWDQREAHEKLLLLEARRLITSVIVVKRQGDKKIVHKIPYVSVGLPYNSESQGYVRIEDVRRNIDQRDFILSQALSGLRAWRVRYATLCKDLGVDLGAIDDVIGGLERKRQKEAV